MNPASLVQAMRMTRPKSREDIGYAALQWQINQINELEKAVFARACMADLGQLWQQEWKQRHGTAT